MTTALALPEVSGAVAVIPEAAACEMARTFAVNTSLIRQAMEQIRACSENLANTFDGARSWDFQIDFSYHADRRADLDGILKGMKRTAWRRLIDKLGVKAIMSVKKREELEKQLESGDLPDITEDAIVGILLGLTGQAKDFAKEAAIEVFELLRPMGGRYKTNDAFRVGKRVILGWMVERNWGKTFRVCYRNESKLTAIDAVFHLMAGKGIMRENRGPLVEAINQSEGTGETEFFKFRCCKNHNLHLEFKRLDLVKQLNGLAVGEHVLGEDSE